MGRIKIALVLIAFGLLGCLDHSASSEKQLTQKNKDIQKALEAKVLNDLAEDYFEASLKLNPFSAPSMGDFRFNDQFGNTLSDEYLRAKALLAKTSLLKLRAINRSVLSSSDQVTYGFLAWEFARSLERMHFPNHLLPINQFRNRINSFARYGSGKSAQPFKTVEDYEAFIKKAKGMQVWVNSAILRMREGMEENIVLPEVLARKILPQLSVHMVSDVKKSIYWGPVKRFPRDFSEADKKRLKVAYEDMIRNTIVPTHESLHAFLQDEYIPKTRKTSGYGDLPNGQAWYQDKIKHYTTTDKTAEEIHAIGLQQVDRILSEMDGVRETVKFKGSLPEFLKYMSEDEKFFFKSSNEVVNAYSRVRKKIEARLPKFFNIKPKMDYVIRPVENYRAATSAGASYESGSPDGTRPGIFYINTYNLKAQPKYLLETLSIHEASPGHHFQSSIQIELKNIPKIRRFGGNTAFSEGWALYAESLGKEMGLFTDPYQYYGRLSDEMLRAMRLVVDTGLHAKDWSREQAIDYMKANSSMAETDIVAEVERYMAIPGQALAYKVGELKIRKMRELANESLGDKFNIREFHNQILASGNIPMEVLDDKVKRWVDAQLENNRG